MCLSTSSGRRPACASKPYRSRKVSPGPACRARTMTGPARHPHEPPAALAGQRGLPREARTASGRRGTGVRAAFDEPEVQVLVADGIAPPGRTAPDPHRERASQGIDLKREVGDEKASQPHGPPPPPRHSETSPVTTTARTNTAALITLAAASAGITTARRTRSSRTRTSARIPPRRTPRAANESTALKLAGGPGPSPWPGSFRLLAGPAGLVWLTSFDPWAVEGN
jgi:hypothetical protein